MVKGKSSYPTLALVAKDVLAIQVSTIASESAFSNSGRVIDPFRSSLTPKSVEALICLQNWLEVRILATLNIKLVRQNLTSIKIVKVVRLAIQLPSFTSMTLAMYLLIYLFLKKFLIFVVEYQRGKEKSISISSNAQNQNNSSS